MDYFIDFQTHGDERGQLVALEESKEIPFNVKRVYYMFDTVSNVRRGYHSHKSLEQVLVCVHGSCKIHLDDGYECKEIELNNPKRGLYIGPNTWREMYDFSADTVLLVLASELYDEGDYIRNYREFLELIKNKI